jgi:hypothetical protein
LQDVLAASKVRYVVEPLSGTAPQPASATLSSARSTLNFIAITDKATGKIVWRLGPDYPPAAPGPRKLPAPVDQISGQHDPQIIPESLPGAGNLLLFDDQGAAASCCRQERWW